MLGVASILAPRCVLDPESVCRLASASRNLRDDVDVDECWRAIRTNVRLRRIPVPDSLRGQHQGRGGMTAVQEAEAAAAGASAKKAFLHRYVWVLPLRRRVRDAWARITAFWLAHVPEAAASLRPGLREEELAEFERRLGAELPEDLAESFRCCDGQSAHWFADADPRRPLFRVLRLLPLAEAIVSDELEADESGAPHGEVWLPLAQLRVRQGLDRRVPKLRLVREPPGRQFEQGSGVWCMDHSELIRLCDSFTTYLVAHADFLEALPAQLPGGEQSEAVDGDSPRAWCSVSPCFALEEVLRRLFREGKIECDTGEAWATTGLGKGKGAHWSWVGRAGAVQIRLPQSLRPQKGGGGGGGARGKGKGRGKYRRG